MDAGRYLGGRYAPSVSQYRLPRSVVPVRYDLTVEPDLEVLARHIADGIARRLDGRPAPRRPGSHIHAVVVRESA